MLPIHRHLLTLLSGALAATLCAGPAAAAPVPKVDPAAVSALGSPFAPGEAIVRFETGTSAGERLDAREAADVTFERSLGLPRTQLVDVDGGVRGAIERLERQPGVAYAQPNYRYRALAVSEPTDTFFSDLWGLRNTGQFTGGTAGIDLDVLDAWDVTRGEGQVVAVVDTGVDLTHPDLVGNLWTGPGGVHGRDFVDDDSNPDDFDFHGTHVAGTIAATAGNGLGIAGVAPKARVMAVRVLDGDGSGFTSDIAAGIQYAGEQGADVINLSLGGPSGDGDEAMEDAIAAAGANGAVVVAAAGNSADDNDDPDEASTPCSLPNQNLICVAAVTPSGALAGFSSYGATTVDVGAPGTSVLSAKADYDAIMTDSFSTGIVGWTPSVANGGLPWGPAILSGNPAVADSPIGDYGNAIDPDDPAASQLVRTEALDLTSKRGCRMHLRMRYDVEEGFDQVLVGAVADGTPSQDVQVFTGTNGASLKATEVSISDLGGRSAVKPAFALFSDEMINADGAYVDDLQVLCRAATYADSKTSSGNYVFFQGTSMATPHVAGVAALARAAAEGAGEDASAAAVIEAVLAGVRVLPSLNGKTATGGMVDAARAISEALGLPEPEDEGSPVTGGGTTSGGGTSGGSVPPSPTPGSSPSPPFTSPAPSSFPKAPRLQSKARVRVRRSRFAIRFSAEPGLSVRAVVGTARKARVGIRGRRRRHLTIERRRLRVPSSGRARLRIRLSRREMRVLRLNRRLRLRVRVTVRDSAGKTATAGKRILLLAPRR